VSAGYSNYDLQPHTQIASSVQCHQGWEEILGAIHRNVTSGQFILCIECYPGVPVSEISDRVRAAVEPALVIESEKLFRPERELNEMLQPYLGDDPVFGRLNPIEIEDFFDTKNLSDAREQVSRAGNELVLLVGPGASLLSNKIDLLVLAEISRWNIQQLQRQKVIGNLGTDNLEDSAGKKYKRAFFVDWRSADRLKIKIFSEIDYLLDLNDPHAPRMISGDVYRQGLEMVANRPFRVVPFFDPGPWGGQWMKRAFNLPPDKLNYAWCFDCVPEENSLLLGFGDRVVEVPALDLILTHPKEVLGPAIFEEFGAEFPIRFDFLDTVEGGNLSLQVHPLRSYISEHFNIPYTQDESYYILDQSGESVVYLGIKDGVEPAAMAAALQKAQVGDAPFAAEEFVNTWTSHKHDHFSVPGGTVHCSGRNNVVLEISATPYIFTFKLWDWGRMGLDGRPRPIHLDHGLANIQWNRTTEWVREQLFNKNEFVAEGDGWREERTGVHHSNFLETRRHWFTGTVPHDTKGTLNVLNLVEGEEVVVESPQDRFPPFVVHYAETFIVPAAVGPYTIRPARQPEKPYATIKAFVRNASIDGN
jgi:mannose-6-phosphate isomerase class I